MRICCSELGVNLPQMLDSLRYLRRSIQAMPYSVIASMRRRTGKAPVQFVIEDADWAIRWVGEGIRNGLPAYARGKMGTTCTPYNLTHQIAHFGSQYMWVDWASHISKTNRTIASFFHGKPEDGPAVEKHIELFLKHEPQLSRIVVSAAAVGERLKAWGVCTAKISHIPIGTDVGLFVPPSFQQREEAREIASLLALLAVGSLDDTHSLRPDPLDQLLVQKLDFRAYAHLALLQEHELQLPQQRLQQP